MKNSLPSLTALLLSLSCELAFGQAYVPAGAGQGVATPYPAVTSDPASQMDQATALVRQVVQSIEARQSILAKVRQQTDLYGHKLVGSGSYMQQGRGVDRRYRFELKIPIGDRVGVFEQICDGDHLWYRQDLAGKLSLSHLDMARVRDAVRDGAGQGNPLFGVGSQGMSIGGLPKLLRNLERSFQFTSISPNRLDTVDVWALQGEWRPDRLLELFPEQKERMLKGKPFTPGKVAEHFPDRVLLVVGRADLFPYRLEYWQRKKATTKDGTVETLHVPLLMEMFEVQLDVPVDPRGFAYKPGDDMEVKQITSEYIKSLYPAPATQPAPAAK